MHKILHKVVVGSRLHGLNNENSDFDYRGIFKDSLLEILSPYRKQSNTSWIEGKEDDTSYELLSFLKMATSGNPTVLEVLWSNQVIETSDIIQELIENRHKLLDDNRIYLAHVGYSENQIKKMDLYNPHPVRTAKTIVAYVRSLRQGMELLKTGDFNPVYEYPDKEFLLEIKNNFSDKLVPEASKLMRDVRKEIEEINSELTFRRSPDIEWIENFILNVYGKDFFG